MIPNDLRYDNLTKRVLRSYRVDGRTESASFLSWFFEHIFRLDDVTAVDAICDGPGDRGIDGIYVDDDGSEILFVQVKVRQNEQSTIGDAAIRNFAGSVAQFDTPDKVLVAIEANDDR